ncbi:MAG: hypothetical protein WD972_00850 [Candidatus Andersenbacteria bacterium]
MSTQRVVKKTVYAGGFAVVIVAAVLGLAAIVRTPAPVPLATPTPVVATRPIVVEQVDVVRHQSSVDIVARLRNPNALAGVKEYPITFVLLNSEQQEIVQHPVTTYLLPGSLQYVVAIGIPVGEVVTEVRVDIPPTPNFTELPRGLDLPNFGSFERERALKPIGRLSYEEQKGILRNNSTVDFNRVQVTALALDERAVVVGVGTTFLGALKVGEQREFTVQWPEPARPTRRVVIFPSTNVFLEENIIRAIGDPSLLR